MEHDNEPGLTGRDPNGEAPLEVVQDGTAEPEAVVFSLNGVTRVRVEMDEAGGKFWYDHVIYPEEGGSIECAPHSTGLLVITVKEGRSVAYNVQNLVRFGDPKLIETT